MDKQIDKRNYDELSKALTLAQHTVYKRYLAELGKYYLVEPTEALKDENPDDCLRFLKLKKFVCKEGEDIFQKLSTVYHASMRLGCNLIVMIDVKSIGEKADIYLGMRNPYIDAQSRKDLSTSFDALRSGLDSNFPGTKYEVQRDMGKLIGESSDDKDGIFGKYTKYISAVSCVASVRDKSKTQDKNFIQGMEKFIDAMREHTYTAVFIAEPINPSELAVIRNGYESLYSTLSSFSKSSWSYNENESTSVMENLSEGISKAVTEGTSQTQAHAYNIGANFGIGSSRSSSQTNSFAESDSFTRPTAGSTAVNAVSGVVQLAATVISAANPIIGAGIGLAGSVLGNAFGRNIHSHSITETIANTVGKTLGINGGVNIGYTNTKSDTASHNETKTRNETRTTGTTESKGTGCTLQIENVNKSIDEMLKRIEEQLKRVKESEDYGSYNCGAYFLAGKQESSLLAANTYRALMIGDGSSVESGAVNFWNGNEESEQGKVRVIKEYLSKFAHPVFAMPISEEMQDISDLVTYTPGTIVSGLELPLHLGLPTKSVYGLPVMEYAEFGRNIIYRNEMEDGRKIRLGSIYHMGKIEKKSAAKLDVQNLSAHTFITGSTGSGKSNTIYKMLEELGKNDVKFLVVEPAKGEYKTVFGMKKDVTVYGTNPKRRDTKLLQINPFRFPKSTHVLEHMDRLVEIFNVCWPMYAAMPAILKDSIERAYEAAGWNLIDSENKYDENLYPSFSDVLVQIKKVLEESDYSSDNKGDYTGSLVTRLKSLTNGINGLVFSNDDISDMQLFDENVIIDLSRVGSSETKALIMGLLVLKLQEYRMEAEKQNADIHHVTVLEEAHNLLRRTSAEQSSESSNLLGKSVEMLANSIAEMRTYGEGFIIADQSPGLLDMSVIRNTNTKIMLRLPDFSDRELVGKAAGLNDDQIVELGRLEKGVAAITQSGWLEPVLCKVEKHEAKEGADITSGSDMDKGNGKYNGKYVQKEDVEKSLLDCIMTKEIYRKGDRVDIQKLRDAVIKSKLSAAVKCDFLDYINAGKEKALEALRPLVYDFFKADKAIKASENRSDIHKWVHKVADNLSPSINSFSKEQIDRVMVLLINEQAERDASYTDICCEFTELYKVNGGVV